MSDSVHSERISTLVAAATVGPNQHLTLPHLIRLFQEAAMQNTVRLAVSSPLLIEKYGLSWVMRRQYLRCFAWPKMGQEIRVVTAPTAIERKLLTRRDFLLLDGQDQILVRATSEWLVMDINSRRPRPLPPEVMGLADGLPPRESILEFPGTSPVAPVPATAQQKFTVAYHQLDFNDHLTNPVYPELMVEPLGGDFLKNHLPAEVDISYQREAAYGDEVTAATAPADNTDAAFHHALYRDESLLATLRSRWEPVV